MKQCLSRLVLLIRRTVFTVKRRASTPLFDLHGHVPVQILTHEPMSVCSFEHYFPLLRLMRRVSTSCINCETWQCAIFHHQTLFFTILTYEDVSMCKFSHRRTCMYTTFHIRNHVRDHWFDPREGLWCVFTVKKRPSVQLFDLHGRVRMQIFSWEDVSVYNLSHNFQRLGSTDMFSTQCVEYKTCSCACSH